MTARAAAVDRVADELAARLPAGRVQRDAPLGALTTYRVGGTARALATPQTPQELDVVASAAAGSGIAVLVVGLGSNLLVADEGFDGLAVMLGRGFCDIAVEGAEVRAGGAAKLPVVARASVRNGLTGFEWAVGVPGSVGGAVRMNAGGHGAEMVDVLSSAEVLDLASARRSRRPVAELGLGYRRSALGPAELVVSAELTLRPGDAEASEALLAEIVQWRRDNQPGGQNAGSVFANPDGDSAGRLIESAGLKGLRVGTAEISPKHANFIQADPGGRAADVAALMAEVRRRVSDAHGVELTAETHLVGFGHGVSSHLGVGSDLGGGLGTQGRPPSEGAPS